MIIINPVTGQTKEDDSFIDIIPTTNGEHLTINCRVRNIATTQGIISTYKDPYTFTNKTINNGVINNLITIVIDSNTFYTNVFGPNWNKKNIMDKVKSKYEDIINLLFKDYKYGKPMLISEIKVKKEAPKVIQTKEQEPIERTIGDDFLEAMDAINELIPVDNIDDPDDVDPDSITIFQDEIADRIDAGDIYEDNNGLLRTSDTDSLVYVLQRPRTNINRRIRLGGINLNKPQSNKHTWISVRGYYWPIKADTYSGRYSNPKSPGVAIYTQDDKTYTNKVIVKNLNDVQIDTNISEQNLLKAIVSCCRVKIKNTKESSHLFGKTNIKRAMMISDKNLEGYPIVDIIPNYTCAKDGVNRDIVIVGGNKGYKFCMSDLEIVFPFANSILKGIIVPKDKTLKIGSKVKIINDKNLKISKGTIVTVMAIRDNGFHSNIDHIKVVTVKDTGGNMFKIWSNCIKVI